MWFALVAPTRPDRLTPGALLRLPVEAVVLAAVVLVVAARPTRALTVSVGAVLAVVTLLKVLDVGAFAVLDRPFNVVTDRGQLGSGVDFVRDSLGPWAARGSVLAAVALVGALFVCLPWAVGRLTAVAARHRRAGVRAVVALGAVWGVCAVSGLQLAPGGPVAAADTGPFVVGKVRAATAAYRDEERFTRGPRGGRLRRPGLRRPVRPGGQGRRHRLRRELRPGRARGTRVAAGANPVGRAKARGSRAWATRHPAPGSPRRRSGAAAGWPTPRCSRG